MSTKIHKLSKGEKVNKLGGNYWISTRLNLKTRCISEKKKNTIVSNSKNTIKKKKNTIVSNSKQYSSKNRFIFLCN